MSAMLLTWWRKVKHMQPQQEPLRAVRIISDQLEASTAELNKAMEVYLDADDPLCAMTVTLLNQRQASNDRKSRS